MRQSFNLPFTQTRSSEQSSDAHPADLSPTCPRPGRAESHALTFPPSDSSNKYFESLLQARSGDTGPGMRLCGWTLGSGRRGT